LGLSAAGLRPEGRSLLKALTINKIWLSKDGRSKNIEIFSTGFLDVQVSDTAFEEAISTKFVSLC